VTPPSTYAGWISGIYIDWPTYTARPAPPRRVVVVAARVGHAGERTSGGGSMGVGSADKIAYERFAGFKNGEVLVRCAFPGPHVSQLQWMLVKATAAIRRIQIHIPRDKFNVACLLQDAVVVAVKYLPGMPPFLEVGFNAVSATTNSMMFVQGSG